MPWSVGAWVMEGVYEIVRLAPDMELRFCEWLVPSSPSLGRAHLYNLLIHVETHPRACGERNSPNQQRFPFAAHSLRLFSLLKFLKGE